MDNYYGGRLVATGSKTCIINPNIRCKNNKHKKRNKKTISKIAFGDKAEEYSNREKYINDIIKRIPGYKKWALIYDDMCKPPSYSESIEIDREIKKCLKDESTYELHSGIESKKEELFDINSVMLIGEFGGETFGDYFENNFKDIDTTKELEKEFLSLMKKMKDMFKGLVDLNNYEISHLDIKENNIVISNKNFKFIDFGLSNKFSNTDHFIQRANNEFRTTRIYTWYPPEYIFAFKTLEEFNNEILLIEENGVLNYRKHTEVLDEMYNFLFDLDLEEYLLNLFQYYKTVDINVFMKEYNDIIKTLDCYSFGLLVPILFYRFGFIDLIHESVMLSEFFNLFKLMTNPNHKKRIEIDIAYKVFEELLNKYSQKGKTKSTKKKKKKKNSKKKNSKKKI